MNDVITTMARATLGLALAIILGVFIGVTMALVRPIRWFFEPLIAIGFPMPTITLIPLFTLWFGIGHESKIFLVALTCFFPIALSTTTGVREVNHYLIWSAKSMGTTEKRMFWKIMLPAASSYIFSGIRIALPLSIIIAFVTEMVAGGGGLGYTLIYGYRFLDTSTVFAAILAVLMLGFFLDRVLLNLRNVLLPWEEELL